jgi:cold shock CspA family protein
MEKPSKENLIIMFDSTRVVGQVYSWNKRGFGLIFVTPQERYFAHISEIRMNRVPELGERVSFVVKPPRKENAGQLPLACDVRPIEAMEVRS